MRAVVVEPGMLVEPRSHSAWCLFGVLSAMFFWQALFGGGVLIPTSPELIAPWNVASNRAVSNGLMVDSLTLTYPWRAYTHESLAQGELPFWNPYIFAGYPHLAAMQSNALYPPVVIFDVFDPVGGIAYAMALHLAIAGGLMYHFLRRLRLSFAAAVLGGVIFEFNGFFLVRMSAPSYVFSGIWTPLLLIGIQDVFGRDGWRSAWKVAAPVCLAALGGHPQILALSLLIGGIYAVFLASESFRVSGRWGDVLGGISRVITTAAVGLAVAGVQLVPFLELVKETTRGGVDLGAVRSMGLPAVSFFQAVLPDVFGHPVERTYYFESVASVGATRASAWGWNYCGENLFIGVLPVLLAALALVRPRRREVIVFGILFAGSLLVVLGASPLPELFYVLVPMFRHSRPDRILYIYMFSVSVLAAFGFAGAMDTSSPRMKWAKWTRACLVLPACPAVLGFILHPMEELSVGREVVTVMWSQRSVFMGPPAPFFAVGAVLAVLLVTVLPRLRSAPRTAFFVVAVTVVAPLFSFGWRFNPVQPAPLFRPNETVSRVREAAGASGRVARIATRALPANTAQLFGLSDVNGSSAAALAHYARIIRAIDPRAIRRDKYFRSFTDASVLRSPLLDFLGATTILSNTDLPLVEVPGTGRRGRLRVFQNPGALPRAFLVGRVETYVSVEDGVRRFVSPEFDPASVALVDVASGVSVADAPLRAVESVEEKAFGAHRIDFLVRTTVPRLLVTSEIDYPGWRVFRDGVAAPKVLVNTAFRGVVVPAGEHRVRFEFVPTSFYVGLGLTSIGVVFLGVSLWWRRASAGTARA